MKKTLLALLLASSFANAAEITASGFGGTYEAALENAKVAALEQGASTFVMSERNARQNRVDETIDEYTSGVIKTYKIVSHQKNMVGHEVTIIADVVPKDNTIKKGKQSSFAPDFNEYDRREKIVNRLDNVGSAIYADVGAPNYKIGRNHTTVYVDVTIAWQPKWVGDMRSFTSTIAEKGSTSTNTHAEISAGVSNAIKGATGSGILGWMAWEATRPGPAPAMRDNQMVCFGTYRNSSVDCRNLDVDIVSFPRSPRLVMVANVNGSQIQIFEQYVDVQLYQFASAGDTRYNRYFPQHKTTLNQPAFMVFENEKQRVPVKFDVDNNLMKNIQSVQVYLR
jgi:hypothetical protein